MDVILGRDAELEALTAAVAGTSTGSQRLVLVEGAPGVGKSTLLSAAAQAAEKAGSLVLRATGIARESDFPFGVVRQVFELLLGDAPAAERRAWLRGPAKIVPQVLDLGTGAVDGPEAVETSHVASHALFWLTANIARRARLVIVLDDLQWADAPSLRWLTHLSRRLDRLPVTVLAGLCSGEPARDPGLIAELLSGLRRIPLSGLDAGSATRLIVDRLHAPPADEFVAACLAETGGNPSLLGVLLRVLAADNLEPTAGLARDLAALAPRRIGEAVVDRLSRSGVDAVRVVTAAAVLGEAELDTVARVAGLAPDVAGTVAAALTRMGILTVRERASLRYGLVRRGLLARLPRAEREQLHLRAARVLFERCAPAATVAGHLAEVASPVGEQWVAQSLREAARTALDGGMPETARAHLRRLLAEPHEPAARAQHMADLGVAEIHLDLPAAVDHLRTAFVQLDEPSRICPVVHRLAGALHDSGAVTEAMALLSDAAERVASTAPDLADAFALHRLSLATWSQASDAGVIGDLDRLLDGLEHRGSPVMLMSWADALRAFRLSLQAGGVGQARAAVTAAAGAVVAREDLCEHQSIAATRIAAVAMLHVGEYEQAIRYCQRQAAYADRRRERQLAAWARALQGCAHNALGRYEQAAASAREALSASAAAGGDKPRPVTVLATAVLSDSLGQLGRCREGLALLDGHPLDGGLADWWVNDQALLVRARLRLRAGHTSGALADALEAGRYSEARGVTNPGAASWRLTAALAHAALGDLTEAIRLVGEQIDLARTAGLAGPLAVALSAAAVFARQPATLAEAIAILAAPGGSETDDPQRQALDLLHRCGDRIVVSQLEQYVAEGQARMCAGDTPAPPGFEHRPRQAFGIGALTAHELRLMAMAVQGKTNGKIAERFGVSRRAVEFHFTHIYQKLGITGRSQLYPFVDAMVS
jgi:DNA-binding CsgD family transcriptional regulator/tetratricopeptide (TPR) repeat protein